MVTEAAQADLEQIDGYVAADSPDAADRLLDDLYAAMQRAAERPDAVGSVREDLTDRDVRFMPVRKNYWVVYATGGRAAVTVGPHHRRSLRRESHAGCVVVRARATSPGRSLLLASAPLALARHHPP